MPSITQEVQGAAPTTINAYSDGSLKNTTGLFWHVGSAGVWWPGRGIETLTTDEKGFAEYKAQKPDADIFRDGVEVGEDGVMLWCPFNSSLNSSTRCELAAAILALLSPYPLNIGIDNATVVGKGNEIIHRRRRREAEDRLSLIHI